jgi:hypothetical protein
LVEVVVDFILVGLQALEDLVVEDGIIIFLMLPALESLGKVIRAVQVLVLSPVLVVGVPVRLVGVPVRMQEMVEMDYEHF